MKETLLQRCQREFWEKNGNPDSLSSVSQFHPDVQGRLPAVINEAIANTLKQAAEEWQGITKNIQYSKPVGLPPQVSQGFQLGVDTILAALTGAQKLIRGELDI